jgi:DNA-binding MarR family transcriptional regulator/N-acetylglutamate synthase-like GNAT family acetyltransferase
MDYIRDLGALALASRMKRLVSRLNSNVKGIYTAQEIEFEPLLMPITRLLADQGKLQANQIADYLGITQPAVTHMCNTLKKHGLITLQQHPKDQRIREVDLNRKGADMVCALQPVWQEIEKAVQQMIEGVDDNLLNALEAFEDQYAKETLQTRVLQQLARQKGAKVRIIAYQDSLKTDFKRLNYEWIEKNFSVEPSDKRMLTNPQRHIIDKGGHIYFAALGKEIVGTYALIRVRAHVYELSKMAVGEAKQKQGIGTALLNHAIVRARAIHAHKLILYSNTLLAPAINLYFKKGFRVVPKDDYHNERANLKMELCLRDHKH